MPPSHTSAEACLMDWPNVRPKGWDKCSAVRHHYACPTMCVKCRCCATSLFQREREVCIRAKGGNGGGNWRGLVPRYLTCSAL